MPEDAYHFLPILCHIRIRTLQIITTRTSECSYSYMQASYIWKREVLRNLNLMPISCIDLNQISSQT